MKEYNRIKRIWEEPQEKTGSLKKPKLCRGGKPHRFQLTLPTYMDKSHSFVSSEGIEEYYRSEQRVIDFVDAESKKLLAYDIHKTWGCSRTKVAKFYKCEVCGKQEAEY